MFNSVVNKDSGTQWVYSMGGRINISDKIVQTPIINEFTFGDYTYYNLAFPYMIFKLESQLTKKVKIFSRGSLTFSVGVNVNCFERWVLLTWNYNTPGTAVEDLSTGKVIVGSDDFPLGFYNLTIYEMETNDDLNPDNAKSTVYNGIVNMFPNSTDYIPANFEEVQYNDYTTNDADTDNVYITY